MKFTGTGIPPTEQEIQLSKDQLTSKKRTIIIAAAATALGVPVFMITTAALNSEGYWLTTSTFIITVIVLVLSTLVLLAELDIIEAKMRYFEPITPDKCVWLVSFLDQSDVAEYCKQVAKQGRQIVEEEYDVIIQNQNERLDKVACRKIYIA